MQVGEVYASPDGTTVTVSSRYSQSQSIGEIWYGDIDFGPLSMGVLMTKAGLSEAGYELISSPEPEPNPE